MAQAVQKARTAARLPLDAAAVQAGTAAQEDRQMETLTTALLILVALLVCAVALRLTGKD